MRESKNRLFNTTESNENDDVTASTYYETLEIIREKVNKALNQTVQNDEKARELERLEVKYYKPLVHQLAHGSSHKDLRKLVALLSDLSDLSEKVGDLTGEVRHYTDAAVCLQYVLTITEEKLNENRHASIHRFLGNLEAKLVQTIGGNHSRATTDLTQEISDNKLTLHTFREKIDEDIRNLMTIQDTEEYIRKSRLLFQTIAETMKQFLSRIYENAELQLSITPPCSYVVVGLGSLALQQITPYSDFEFAILLKHDDPRARKHFENLTHLVNFKMINLGETVIPTSNYGLDLAHLVHVGVNLDLGGKTPLGRLNNDKPYSLIQTVDGMLNYVRNKDDKASHIDKCLPYILENVCYVYGDEELVKVYQQKVQEFLLSRNLDDPDNRLNCEIRALRLLEEGSVELDYVNRVAGENPKELVFKGDLYKLRPQLFQSTGKYFNVKQEIYRLPDRMIYNFGLYYGAVGISSWDTVDNMVHSCIISEKAGENLKFATSFATLLRLETYSHHRSQAEGMSVFSESESDLFKLDITTRPNLFRFYFIALPLHEELQSFCYQHRALKDSDRHLYFQDIEFFDDSWDMRGYVHIRLAQLEQAKLCLEKALEDPGSKELKIRTMLGNLYYNIGHHDQSIDQYQKCLTILGPTDQSPTMAHILNSLGLVHMQKGDTDLAIKYYKDSVDIRKTNNTKDEHQEIIGTLNNLGSAYKLKGDYDKAIKCYRECLKTMKGESFAICLENLASALKDRGQYEEALDHNKESLKLNRQTYKNEPHELIFNSLNNLGATYVDLDDLDEAVDCYKECLKIGEVLYGTAPHEKMAICLGNLGKAYAKQGSYDLALQYLMQSLKMCIVIYRGDQHPAVANTLNNIGLTYERMGDFQLAIRSYGKSLRTFKSLGFEETRPEISTIYHNLGSAHDSLGSFDSAIEFYEKALAIDRGLHKSNDHLSISITLNNLGLLYRKRGDYDLAIQHYQESLGIKVGVFQDGTHSSIAAVLNNLGTVYEAKGQYDEATKYLEQCLEMYKEVYDSGVHPSIGTTMNNLGQVLMHQCRYPQAMENFSKSLEIFDLFFNQRSHPKTAQVLSNLGTVYRHTGSFDQSLEYCQRSLKMKQDIYQNDSHYDLASAYNNLGSTYLEIGKLNMAIVNFEKSLAIAKAADQSNAPDVAIYMGKLALALEKRGELNAALEMFQSSIEIFRCTIQGRPHPDLAVGLSNLGDLLVKLERNEQAIDCYEEGREIYETLYQDIPHPGLVVIQDKLGMVYLDKGLVDKAMDLFQKGLTMREEIFSGGLHPSIAVSYSNLGGANQQKGDLNQAVCYYEKGYNIQKEIFKEQPHVDLINSLDNLGSAYLDLGRVNRSIEWYLESLKMKRKFFGKTPSLETAVTLDNLGYAYESLENFVQAESEGGH